MHDLYTLQNVFLHLICKWNQQSILDMQNESKLDSFNERKKKICILFFVKFEYYG